MVNSSKSDADTIPLAKIPYAFRKRLQQLVTPGIQNNSFAVCSLLDNRLPFMAHEQVFITDNHVVGREAMKDTFLFRILKCLDQFKCWRRTKDGPFTFYPVWRSVLLVNEIVDGEKHVYVDDGLIMHCQVENFEKVIPKIFGSYTRLVLHGTIRWNQLKRLIHPGVKQVRVGGIIYIQPTEYDEFVEFLIDHSRGLDYTFAFFGKNHFYDDELLIGLYESFSNHETHSFEHTLDDDMFHVLHDDGDSDYNQYGLGLYAFLLVITILIPIILLFVPGSVIIMPAVVEKINKVTLFSVSTPCFSIFLFNLFLIIGVPLKPLDVISEDPTTNPIVNV